MMNEFKYFSIDELCRSKTALAKKIDNYTVDDDILRNLRELIVNVLDPVREIARQPVIVNSGYRCKKLNEEIGGAKNSQHVKGQAADITLGNKDKNRELFDKIINSDIEYDQLIDENDFSWIHVSYNKGKNRKQVLKL